MGKNFYINFSTLFEIEISYAIILSVGKSKNLAFRSWFRFEFELLTEFLMFGDASMIESWLLSTPMQAGCLECSSELVLVFAACLDLFKQSYQHCPIEDGQESP